MEEEIKLKDKKKAILICSITIISLMLIVGVSYAYWQRTKVQEDTNFISSGCFGVSLEGNEAINLSSQYPMKKDEGMQTTPYTFTITNTCSGSANYVVNLESLSNTTFQNTSIRVALNDTHKLYSAYTESSKYYTDSKESRTLISGTLENSGSVTYNLRIWIDENAPATEQNKIFASKIVVTSGQEGEGIVPTIENLEATSTTDSINITYQANGDVSTTCKYGLTEGTYDTTVEDATATACNITGLNENTTYYYQICTEIGKGMKCVDGEIKTQVTPLSERVELGDYISMTPTSTSYTPPSSLTGYTGSSQEALNPSELNLWRVIRKNEDGTIDMVSDKISSTEVYFQGKTGYINFVKGLNTIAAQYTDGKHVARTRHIGYSNQTETITSTSKLEQTTKPWSIPTYNYNLTSCDTSKYLCGTDETKGAGDIGAQKDYDLVNAVYGNVYGKFPNGSVHAYWLASREYTTSYKSGWAFEGSGIGSVGRPIASPIYHYDGEVFGDSEPKLPIRPIVSLKSDTRVVSGDGQSADTAYTLD